jgi:hypothetical protein
MFASALQDHADMSTTLSIKERMNIFGTRPMEVPVR